MVTVARYYVDESECTCESKTGWKEHNRLMELHGVDEDWSCENLGKGFKLPCPISNLTALNEVMSKCFYEARF